LPHQRVRMGATGLQGHVGVHQQRPLDAVVASGEQQGLAAAGHEGNSSAAGAAAPPTETRCAAARRRPAWSARQVPGSKRPARPRGKSRGLVKA
ncbi:hypothetical protein ADL26_07850, partial [Thermoactinomyces vulgaris]